MLPHPVGPAEPSRQRFANPWARFFFATRPQFLSVTLIACLIGLASAYAELGRLDGLRAALTLLLALAAHAAANVMNDYHDSRNGADEANVRRVFPFTGGSRFIQNGVMTQRQTAVFGYALLLSTILAGLWLTWQAGIGLLAIGALGIGLAWAYSAPPLQLVGRGMGEAVIAGCWLLVVIGADYVQRGRFAWEPVAAGFSYAVLVAALLYINQFPDHDGDHAAGKRTLVVRLGRRRARWGYSVLVLVAYAWLAVQIGGRYLPVWCAAAALALPLSWKAAQGLGRHALQPERMRPAIQLTIVAALLHGLILAAALALHHYGVARPDPRAGAFRAMSAAAPSGRPATISAAICCSVIGLPNR